MPEPMYVLALVRVNVLYHCIATHISKIDQPLTHALSVYAMELLVENLIKGYQCRSSKMLFLQDVYK